MAKSKEKPETSRQTEAEATAAPGAGAQAQATPAKPNLLVLLAFAIAFILIAALVANRAIELSKPTATPTPVPTIEPTPVPAVEITPTPKPTATPVPTPRLVKITACGEITEAGTYYLESGVELSATGGTCISIKANGVVLNCQGNEIKTRGTDNTGILLDGANNSEVKNCKVSRFLQDILVRNSHYSKITSNILSGFQTGIAVEGSSQNAIIQNNATGFSNGPALKLTRSSFNTVSQNELSKSQFGAFFNYSDSNAILNNSVRDNLFVGAWFANSNGNTAIGNNFSASFKLEGHRAGVIVQNSVAAFQNNTVCTPASFDFECSNGNAQDLGGNSCVPKSECVACGPCPK